jgi:hypothetical protein
MLKIQGWVKPDGIREKRQRNPTKVLLGLGFALLNPTYGKDLSVNQGFYLNL